MNKFVQASATFAGLGQIVNVIQSPFTPIIAGGILGVVQRAITGDQQIQLGNVRGSQGAQPLSQLDQNESDLLNQAVVQQQNVDNQRQVLIQQQIDVRDVVQNVAIITQRREIEESKQQPSQDIEDVNQAINGLGLLSGGLAFDFRDQATYPYHISVLVEQIIQWIDFTDFGLSQANRSLLQQLILLVLTDENSLQGSQNEFIDRLITLTAQLSRNRDPRLMMNEQQQRSFSLLCDYISKQQQRQRPNNDLLQGVQIARVSDYIRTLAFQLIPSLSPFTYASNVITMIQGINQDRGNTLRPLQPTGSQFTALTTLFFNYETARSILDSGRASSHETGILRDFMKAIDGYIRSLQTSARPTLTLATMNQFMLKLRIDYRQMIQFQDSDQSINPLNNIRQMEDSKRVDINQIQEESEVAFEDEDSNLRQILHGSALFSAQNQIADNKKKRNKELFDKQWRKQLTDDVTMEQDEPINIDEIIRNASQSNDLRMRRMASVIERIRQMQQLSQQNVGIDGVLIDESTNAQLNEPLLTEYLVGSQDYNQNQQPFMQVYNQNQQPVMQVDQIWMDQINADYAYSRENIAQLILQFRQAIQGSIDNITDRVRLMGDISEIVDSIASAPEWINNLLNSLSPELQRFIPPHFRAVIRLFVIASSAYNRMRASTSIRPAVQSMVQQAIQAIPDVRQRALALQARISQLERRNVLQLFGLSITVSGVGYEIYQVLIGKKQPPKITDIIIKKPVVIKDKPSNNDIKDDEPVTIGDSIKTSNDSINIVLKRAMPLRRRELKEGRLSEIDAVGVQTKKGRRPRVNNKD